MKRAAYIFIISLLCLVSCDPEPVLIGESQAIADAGHTGVYVLSEGLFNLNNSTLSWIDFSTGLPDSWSAPTGNSYDCFEKVNGRRLGDTANDILLYGSRLYIAVNVSSTIEILDAATGHSLKQIQMSRNGNPSEPRYMTANGHYVYVCSFDGTVTRIDTLTMKADATVTVGRNPDGICCTAGKLYVSNSGGLDFDNPDSTVSVIDLATFSEIKRISVRQNPGSIYADGNRVYVVSRGIYDYDKNDYDSRLHCIDTENDQVIETYDIPILKMDLHDGQAWFYGYGSGGTIQILDLASGRIIDSDFITDGTIIERPYGIKVEPTSHKVYVCDAADYVTPGSLCCFAPDGHLLYRIRNIGINPNTIVFCDVPVTLNEYQGEVQNKSDIDSVCQYMPAPGQFVGEMPKYEEGDDSLSMAGKCLELLQKGEMITLGGFGGYVTVRFKQTVHNLSGADFRIDGNAFEGSSEPGVVWVSADVNGNGKPDDPWYELYGSEQAAGRSTKGYTVTYTKPSASNMDTPWTGSDGREGSILYNAYHGHYYYPMWYDTATKAFTGTLLPENMYQEGTKWVMSSFEYGYVDNLSNSPENSSFDIDLAHDSNGLPVHLDSIRFVRIQCAVIGCNRLTGEESTEVSTIYNLHPDADQ
ncbi:MAG: YncE family protein [Bacteroidaceae bacterium]|nr:YncE family protein [Bacteroidaceae bacterium]